LDDVVTNLGSDDAAGLIGLERERGNFQLGIAKLAAREREFAAGVFGGRIIGILPGQRGKLLSVFCAFEKLADLLPFLLFGFFTQLLASERVPGREQNVRGAHGFRALELLAI